VETAAGAYDAAASFLDDARTRYAALDARPELARVDAALGRLAEAQGNTVKAAAHRRAAFDAFTALEMRWDAEQVGSGQWAVGSR
jgi:hypothetical protein